MLCSVGDVSSEQVVFFARQNTANPTMQHDIACTGLVAFEQLDTIFEPCWVCCQKQSTKTRYLLLVVIEVRMRFSKP